MAINPELIETKTIPQLPDLALALENFFAHSGANGIAGKATINQLVTLISTQIPALDSSPFVPNTGTPLPNPIEKPTAITFVGVGTFDQTTGADVVTTEELNVLFWSSNGTTGTWTIGVAIPINLIDYILKADVKDIGLFDEAYIQVNKNIASNGNIGSTAGYKSVIGLPISANTQYTVGGFLGINTKYLAFADAGGVVVGTPKILTTVPVIVTSPPTAVTMRFTIKSASEADDTGWKNKAFIFTPTAFAKGTGAFSVIGKNFVAKFLSNDNQVTDPTTDYNAVNLKYFNLNAIRETDLTIDPSSNLAKTSLIVSDFFIDSSGVFGAGSGWKVIAIPVVAGQVLTFGNFTIDTGGYSSFYSAVGGSMLQFNGSYTSGALPKTVTAPSGATILYIDLARPTNIPANYEFATVNLGTDLLPYENPAGVIIAIKGIPIGGGSSNVTKFSDLTDVPTYTGNAGKVLIINDYEDAVIASGGFVKENSDAVLNSLEVQVLRVNRPVGAGIIPIGVAIGDEWVDSSAGGVVKVRLS